ncbi:hypothetical protein AX17_001788 [Amanita inopinata Kibby_2008]|nr:hypothetical protein AX17_001788 [Amanita inopinata Kibby_2008]
MTPHEEFTTTSTVPASDISDTEPSEELKRQIKERIQLNLQKLYQDAYEQYKRRLQDVRSDEQRARLMEEHELEKGNIRTIGAEAYHNELEFERQQHKWASGQPIDEAWKQTLMREHRKALDSYKSAGSTHDTPMQDESQTARSSGNTADIRTHAVTRSMPVPDYNPPPLPFEIEQSRLSKASQSREERPIPGLRVRRESDTVASAAKEEYRRAALIPGADERVPFFEPWSSRELTDEPESSLYNHHNKSRASIERSPNLDRSEDDRPNNRSAERLARSATDRYAPNSPSKHEIWRPPASAEEEVTSAKRSLVRRGSTASQRSIGSTTIRSLTTEPIPERPDTDETSYKQAEHGDEGQVVQSSDKGKEKQGQSRTLQIATEQSDRWEEQQSGRLVERPQGAYPHPTPQRSASVKVSFTEDDRGHQPNSYQTPPRRLVPKASFPTDSIESRFNGSSSIIDEPRHDYLYRSSSTVHTHRPIVPRTSFNSIDSRDRVEGVRFGPEWHSNSPSATRSNAGRDYRGVDDNWTGSLRLRDHHQRPFPSSPYMDDSYVSYHRQSPEFSRPPLVRGSSFTRPVDDYNVNNGLGYSEEHHSRQYTQPPATASIPINRGKPPHTSFDDYGVSNWREWSKLSEGRPLDSRSSYEYYGPPGSWKDGRRSPVSTSHQTRVHDFGGRDMNDRYGHDHKPDDESERTLAMMRKRAEELARLEKEEAAKREEAERLVEEAVKKQEEAMEEARRMKERVEEIKRKEEEAKRKEEEARRKEEEVKRKEEEAQRKEEEIRQKEEEAKRKEREINKKEAEARRKENEARKKARRLEEDARRIEEEARRREEEAERREEEVRRLEEVARRIEEDARRREEEAERREEEAERREEEAERREEEALRRAEEVRKKEEETKKKEEEIRRREEELKKREEELKRREGEAMRQGDEREMRRAEEERQREEAAKRHAEEVKKEEERRKRQEEERRRRQEERQKRQEEERRKQEEEDMRNRQEEEKRRKEAERQEEARRQEEEKRRLEGEKRRKEQEELMRKEREKRWGEDVHSQQQGGYDKQREEIQKRKAGERKRHDSGIGADSSFVSSSPTPTPTSPLSPTAGRPSSTPRRTGSIPNPSSAAPAWTTASGSAWKTSASATPSSTSTTSSARNSTTSATSASTSTSIPTSAPTPTPTPTPKAKPAPSGPSMSESEWARRQAEQAKEQQERFRREQEQMENERQAREAARGMNEKDMAHLYQMHEATWKNLNAFELLRWESFPWPMLKKPRTAEDITSHAIRVYLFGKWYPEDNKSDKDRAKEHIRRWHPDKFNAKYLPKVIEDDRERVMEAAGAVVRGLNDILTRANAPSLF